MQMQHEIKVYIIFFKYKHSYLGLVLNSFVLHLLSNFICRSLSLGALSVECFPVQSTLREVWDNIGLFALVGTLVGMFWGLGWERLDMGEIKVGLICWLVSLLSSVSSFFGQEGDNEAFWHLFKWSAL